MEVTGRKAHSRGAASEEVCPFRLFILDNDWPDQGFLADLLGAVDRHVSGDENTSLIDSGNRPEVSIVETALYKERRGLNKSKKEGGATRGARPRENARQCCRRGGGARLTKLD